MQVTGSNGTPAAGSAVADVLTPHAAMAGQSGAGARSATAFAGESSWCATIPDPQHRCPAQPNGAA
ncbi:MAG: hypothetical protein AMS20_14140 [Gemmatimonas sp. SG8_28]|nr:MAG: hypothetical protein AMS20_14140 [Gemmatimonas sp. SG8_28]